MNKTNKQPTKKANRTATNDIFIIKADDLKPLKTAPQTAPATETENKLNDLMQDRNNLIKKGFAPCERFEKVNTEIITTISEMACYKTLKFLMSNNATNGTETEQTENGTTNTYGYNMALKLFNNLYNDIKLMHNPEIITDILTDSADLIQESNETLTPYFNNLVIFNLNDVIYTKTLKNGNIKEYTAFSLACKSIRSYITEQDKKQYKKLGYCIGFTDNGKEVITTKRPKNDITDIDHEQKTAFISKYNLTALEQDILLIVLNGGNYLTAIEQLNISKDMFYRTLKTAKEKIQKADKRIKL